MERSVGLTLCRTQRFHPQRVPHHQLRRLACMERCQERVGIALWALRSLPIVMEVRSNRTEKRVPGSIESVINRVGEPRRERCKITVNEKGLVSSIT